MQILFNMVNNVVTIMYSTKRLKTSKQKIQKNRGVSMVVKKKVVTKKKVVAKKEIKKDKCGCNCNCQ